MANSERCSRSCSRTSPRSTSGVPEVLGRIERGEIHLSALILLRDHLTDDNHEELVSAASGKSKRAVQELIATRFPKPDVPALVRKLPSKPAKDESAASPLISTRSIHVEAPKPEPLFPRPLPKATGSSGTPAATELAQAAMVAKPDVALAATSVTSSTTGVASAPARVLPANAKVEPLSAARYKVQLTASAELRDKIDRATELMRHRRPSGDLAVIVERALDLLIADLEKERMGKTARPQQVARAASPDRVTRSARREVFETDGEQCSFLSEAGERCPSRSFLEMDHVHPRALGGGSKVENLRILCRAHNMLLAEQTFGREHIARRIHMRQHQSKSRDEKPKAGDPSPTRYAESSSPAS